MVAGTLSTSTPRWRLAPAAANILPDDHTANASSTNAAGTRPNPTAASLRPRPLVQLAPSVGHRAQTRTGTAATTTVSFTNAATVTRATARAIRLLRKASAAPVST